MTFKSVVSDYQSDPLAEETYPRGAAGGRVALK